MFLILMVAHSATARAQSDDDEPPEFLPGLVATYTSDGGRAATRLDSDVQFVWGETAPDPRLPLGQPFSASWAGRLLVNFPGQYHLHVYTQGELKLTINGAVVLQVNSAEPAWHATKPIELEYGHQSLAIEYRRTGSAGRLGLYWSGPQFPLEPIPERHLFHEPKATPDAKFEQGQLLARALRCAACHEASPGQEALTAPALTHLADNLSPAWLVDWLTAAAPVKGDEITPVDQVMRRMPHLGLSKSDAEAISAYLFEASRESAAPTPYVEPKTKPKKSSSKSDKKKPPEEPPRTKPSREAGETLVNTLGCLACHRVEERGAQTLFGGGDLTKIAAKRSRDFLARWLENPAAVNAAHRMPVFTLSPLERADLVLYLASLGAIEERKRNNKENIVARGRALVVEHRCAACHQLPDGDAKPPAEVQPLTAIARWDSSCLGEPDAKARRPGYALTAAQRDALRRYLTSRPAVQPNQKAPLDGRFVLAERNCLACHARGLQPGIASHLDRVVAADERLAPLLPALAPPSLSGVGDKLHDDALKSAILLKYEPLRPWLSIRMPKFPLSDAEMQALTRHLVEHDRIPDLPAAPAAATEETVRQLAGSRLVTSDGFGCTSCHKIGHSEPVKVALNAHGTDLSMTGSRIRRPWFDRWVRNPARIVPRMEMPAIQQPVRGVLHENVGEQLAAVWDVLNTPGFEPPLPNPVRVVRARNVPGISEPAAILTDVLEVGKTVFPRPLLIGLPNRHNVLFDLEKGRLASWWIGDTARERTRGKSWYWEAGGTPLWPVDDDDESELMLRREGKTISPTPQGQNVFELDSFRHVPGGVQFAYRLEYPDAGVVSIEQTIVAGAADPETKTRVALSRIVVVNGLTGGYRPVLRVLPAGTASFETNHVRIASSTPHLADKSTMLEFEASAISGRFRCSIDYAVDLPADQFPVEIPKVEPPSTVKLDVVPGYEAVRLPLPPDEMPTGLAWRGDGTLVVASLKGRVCLTRDTNGDGLEDSLVPFSDDLPAPYGVATNGDGTIDVICKFGLVRLFDEHGGGRAVRSAVIADGWGFTPDYHDWAVGLPRDREGNYYVALPCQQDDRNEAAAKWRGQGLKLIPKRNSTRDDVRLFDVEPFCAGLRFPMGLALNRAGDLFASDNQGNYNPFNELNHLAPGQRYGFINKREVQPGFAPPFRAPAIDLPHPWTRSVNGICFLDTPDSVRKKLGRDLFGRFEGHLLGCEYNGLTLIRMSLEKVGDTYQGAAYPFCTLPAEGQPTFEGPVVCEVAPDGDVYVGNLHDSGWGGGQNTGSIVRLRPQGELPAGIAEVRATTDGFTIDFTQPVDAKKARDAKHYNVLAYHRISTPAYGGMNVDEHPVHIASVRLADDARSVKLHVDHLREGFVYEFRLSNLAPADRNFFPAEAHYTLRRIPE